MLDLVGVGFAIRGEKPWNSYQDGWMLADEVHLVIVVSERDVEHLFGGWKEGVLKKE